MKGITAKIRESQRDYLLERVMSESPVDKNTILSYLLLKQTLANAEVYDDDVLLPEYVEINSTVTIKTSFGYKFGLKVVLPKEGDIQSNKLSALSSLGCAIFGRKEGEKVKWYFDGEEEYAEIIRVTLPTAEQVSVFRHPQNQL